MMARRYPLTKHMPPDQIVPRCTTPAVPNGLILQGTGGTIQGVGLLEPCKPDVPIKELSERLSRDGVVWVKCLLDPALVNKFRGDYLSMVDQGTNMLEPGTDPVDGIFSGED
ncbi:hypothetical protein FJTKL_05623 [Diaporthe vaccinii]|uniref:Uncharacterized protein n=1 Tax=Diaporthe vaccinii TaxID=105482 RepID=A0ABR4DRP4_9PEZI